MIIKPMLAQPAGKPFNRQNYIYEPKLDGVRCVAYLDDYSTRLQARSGKDITFKFPELAELYMQIKQPCILDGEIIGESFNAVQHRIHQEKPFAIRMVQHVYPMTFNVFDQISLNGDSTEGLQLVDRKDLLTANFVPSEVGKLVPWYKDYVIAENIYKDTEGIMAKYMFSAYAEGYRSAHWLKIKNFKEATFCICGLTEGENDRRSTFGALILGAYVDGKLTYVGNVGTGFTQGMLTSILALANKYKGNCPFERMPAVDRAVLFWTEPHLWTPSLKCEVRYLPNLTVRLDRSTDDGKLERMPDAGKLRFPSFRKVVK